MGLAANHITVVLLCFASLVVLVSAQNLTTFTAVYPNFNNFIHFSTILDLEGSATISNNTLRLTEDDIKLGKIFLNDQSGRVMLKQPFKIWEESNKKNNYPVSDRVASFNSSFLFNIYRIDNSTGGEGLTFLVAPDLNLPANSNGQYLGLTNSFTDGNPNNQVVAIELDNFKEAFDPDNNHVGLNIHSIISRNTTSLTPLGIEIAPANEVRFYNVWVQYDGVNKVIEVYVARQQNLDGYTPPRPSMPVLKESLDLRGLVNQFSYFGFSASTESGKQINSILRWNLTVEHYPGGITTEIKPGLTGARILIIVVVTVAVAVGLGYIYYCYRKKKMERSKSNNKLGVALRRLPGTPREFQFKDLKKATNNFDEKNKLGRGGFGVVYRGHLQNKNSSNMEEVAVKWFSRDNIKSQDDFLAELTIINRLRHKHLVRLLGWCHKNGKLLLVYDYMPNGSLDMHLFGAKADREPLNWDLRYKIITGVASALHYVHNEYDQRVVHRDLKASNIMLESDFNARLGDFGLARTLENEKTSYTEVEGVMGTMGYIAPECYLTGKATQQSDVYAFGAVLLEVVCGLRPGTRIEEFQFLVDWVWSLHREGRLLDAVDKRLGQDYVAEEVEKLLLLGLACSHPIGVERPKTKEIVQIISGSLPVPHVPPFKPVFIWQSMPDIGEDSTYDFTTEISSFPTTHLGSVWPTQQCVSLEKQGPHSCDNLDMV